VHSTLLALWNEGNRKKEAEDEEEEKGTPCDPMYSIHAVSQ
jgi:hypothetical protein